MISNEMIAAIIAAANSSALMTHSWTGRGLAPKGYTKGMAVAFGCAVADLKGSSGWAIRAGLSNSGNDEVDAISWYNSRFTALGMSNAMPGVDTLRHLFDLMIGLGMRESSGRYCEGRDRSASNTTASTAEAGMFQQSWNSSSASPLLVGIFQRWQSTPDGDGLLSIFKEGVTPHSGDLDNYGSGDGANFQRMCKQYPLFAVQMAAVGLRCIRKHWGPINRHEAEVLAISDELLRKVQAIVEASTVLPMTPPPAPAAKPPHDASWPPAPPWPPLVSNDARAAIYGKYSYVSAPTSDNPERIRITDGWDAKNIVFVPIPQMAKRGIGTGMQFHRLGANQLKRMWARWEEAGLLDRVLEWDGSYVPRFVRGSRSTLSNHSFGCAFDINYQWNQLGTTPPLAGDKGSVRELVPIANECGFFWGGHYAGRKDGMHFELTKVDGGQVFRDLRWAQDALNRLGANPPLAVDGTMGLKTLAALKAFQKGAGEAADGILGDRTIRALEKALSPPAASPSDLAANPLQGKVYRYLIGADRGLEGAPGFVTEVPFDYQSVPAGVGVKYGNLFDEDFDAAHGIGNYGPYLKGDDVAQAYGEGQIDPMGAGWMRNIRDQVIRARTQGFSIIEWDNPDAKDYTIEDVTQALDASLKAGLSVVAKNAPLTTDPVAYLRHASVIGLVVEKGCGNPAIVQRQRTDADKPNLPTVFVFFGDNRAAAAQIADQITAAGYKGMSVTLSPTGEYTTCEVILAPLT